MSTRARPTAARITQAGADVVLVDEADGSDPAISLIRSLKEQDGEIKVIVLTLQMGGDWFERAFAAGADAAMSKAIHPAALATLVRETVAGHIVHSPARIRAYCRSDLSRDRALLSHRTRIRDPATRRFGGNQRRDRSAALDHPADCEVPRLERLPEARRRQPHRGVPLCACERSWPRREPLAAAAWNACARHRFVASGFPRVAVRSVRYSSMKLRGVVVVENGVSSRRSQGWIHVPALEPVANRPILEHVLDALHLAGAEEIVMVAPAGVADTVRERVDARDDLAIRYVQQDAPVDLAAAVRLAAPIVGDAPCIVHRGAGLLDEPLTRFVTRLRNAPDALVIVHQHSSRDEHLSAANQDTLHLAAFQPDHTLGMAGVWLFGAGAMEIVGSHRARSEKTSTSLGCAGGSDAAGGTLHVELADSWRQYRGDPLELLELNRIVLDRLASGVRWPVNHGNRIEGRVWIHETASVRGSVIVGPSVIGPGARVADSYIGPYTSIGERARVEGAEVERSIISPGASVSMSGGGLSLVSLGETPACFATFPCRALFACGLAKARRWRSADRARVSAQQRSRLSRVRAGSPRYPSSTSAALAMSATSP